MDGLLRERRTSNTRFLRLGLNQHGQHFRPSFCQLSSHLLVQHGTQRARRVRFREHAPRNTVEGPFSCPHGGDGEAR